MIKDTFFSAPRFMNLCRKEMVENWKSNILRMVLLYEVIAVVMIWNGCSEYNSGYNNVERNDPMWMFLLLVFSCSLWGFGCLSASFTMEKMKSKASRLSVLMTPATPFEKYFSRWLISTIVYLVVFLIAYKLADYTRVLVFSIAYPDIISITPVDLSLIVGNGDHYTLARDNWAIVALIASYLFTQSCFVLGSSIWPKNSFLKTFAAGAIITIVYVSLTGIIIKSFLMNNMRNPFETEFVSRDAGLGLMAAAFILFALLNWVLAYFRFKESEIINRM